ncbi:response regulator [Oribacterium sp. C9]|uniref:response regulator n=1 Tax=Oribacterium sp. C9 TaxID=1943579 RepID=UPI00098F4DA9|nr:response regulator [Oribacterium sp. C9]
MYKVMENRSRKLIMVVDDNAMTLRSIKEMLQEYYDIAVATSGMKALTTMGKNPPDLILLDYEMPVCDGKQTLEMIRADSEFETIPVIFLTSVSDREHVEAVLSLKPAGYILKPPVKEKLMGAIREAIKD